jgi:hypothetical protein
MSDIEKRNPLVDWHRIGTAYFPNPYFLVGDEYQYNRNDKIAKTEDWSQSALLIHNPNALQPIEPDLFPQFSHASEHAGNLIIEIPRFHPITSKTVMFPTSKKAFEDLMKKANERKMKNKPSKEKQ